MKTSKFNMIEVVISLFIILLIVMGIMFIFPSSVENNKISIDNVTASDSASDIREYIQTQLHNNLDFLNSIPDEKNLSIDNELSYSEKNLMNNTSNYLYFQTDNPIQEFDPLIHDSGIFLLERKTVKSKDFISYCRMWKEVELYNEDGSTPTDWLPKKVKIYIELSWPIEKPYSERKNLIVSLDHFVSQKNADLLRNEDCRVRGELTDGWFNINPNNSSEELYLRTKTIYGEITMETLKSWNKDKNAPSSVSGVAARICIRIKTGGNANNTIKVGGEPYSFNSEFYVIRARNITFELLQTSGGNGSWELHIVGSSRDASIDSCDTICD
jgi:hypothetical protein